MNDKELNYFFCIVVFVAVSFCWIGYTIGVQSGQQDAVKGIWHGQFVTNSVVTWQNTGK